MAEELKCPKCGAEVDADQKMCAWCGTDLPKMAPPPQPKPLPQAAGPSVGAHSAHTPHLSRQNGNGGSPATRVSSVEEARTLARSGDLEGALAAFEEILNTDPHHQEALFGLGGVHFKKGDKRKAAEIWLKLRRVNPAYPHIDSWISQVQDAIAPPIQTSPSSPPSRPATTPLPTQASSPTAFPRRPTQPRRRDEMNLAVETHEGDDDWTKQSVRVDVTKQKEVVVEPATIEEPTPPRNEPIPEFRPNPIPVWVTPLSWILVMGYAVLFVWSYFLIK